MDVCRPIQPAWAKTIVLPGADNPRVASKCAARNWELGAESLPDKPFIMLPCTDIRISYREVRGSQSRIAPQRGKRWRCRQLCPRASETRSNSVGMAREREQAASDRGWPGHAPAARRAQGSGARQVRLQHRFATIHSRGVIIHSRGVIKKIREKMVRQVRRCGCSRSPAAARC